MGQAEGVYATECRRLVAGQVDHDPVRILRITDLQPAVIQKILRGPTHGPHIAVAVDRRDGMNILQDDQEPGRGHATLPGQG